MTVTADTATDPTGRLQTRNGIDFAVADLALAEFGRKEIRLAEHEMPGLMALRREYAEARPLHGARISGSLHMTVQTAVLIETLVEPGRRRALGVAATSSPPRTTPPPRSSSARTAPPEEPKGVPVFAWKGETLEEYWWCTEQHAHAGRRDGDIVGPNMILDDGGDATLLVHKGVEYEKTGVVPTVDDDDLTISEEYAVILDTAAPLAGRRPAALDHGRRATSAASPRRPPPACTGSTSWPSRASCCSRRSTSTTRSPRASSTTSYGIRHSLIDGINRATDVLIGGKVALVVRLRRRGQGLRPSRCAARAPG